MTFVRLVHAASEAAPDPNPQPTPDGAPDSDFARVGGEAGLRAIIEDFMAHVFGDVMIGFLFAAAPKARVREMEYRYAAAHLGGPVVYDGRALSEAHRAHPISGGHFMRRRHLLSETLERHAVPANVIGRWLAHVDAQRAQVLGRPEDGWVDACDPEGAGGAG